MFENETEETPSTLIEVLDLPPGMTMAAIDLEGRCIETSQVDFEGEVDDVIAGLQDLLDFFQKHRETCRFQARGE